MTSAEAFTGEPHVLYVSEKEQRGVTGIAATSSHLYVVRHGADHVEVRDKEKFNVTQSIHIPGLKSARGLAACEHYNCLYISDDELKVIHRVDLSNKSVTKWSVNGQPCGISLTRKHNLIVTLCDTKRIVEYTTQGSLLREISLNDSIDCPYSCIELSTGLFVISHENEKKMCTQTE